MSDELADRMKVLARTKLRELAARDLARLLSTNASINPFAARLPTGTDFATYRQKLRDCLADLKEDTP